MATPLGHVLAGYAIYGFARAPKAGEHPGLAVLGVIMAAAPDLDLIPGLLVGQPALYHGGISHSLGFALLISLGVAGISKMRGKVFLPVFVVGLLAYSSHLLLDWLGPDGRPPFGIPVFWPISNETFISPVPVPVLPGVRHAGVTEASISEWIQGILSLHNVAAVVVEAALIAPFIFLAYWPEKALGHPAIQRNTGRGNTACAESAVR
jgi:inner membrane protein